MGDLKSVFTSRYFLAAIFTLMVGVIVHYFLFQMPQKPDLFIARIEKNIEAEISHVNSDFAHFKTHLEKHPSLTFTDLKQSSAYPYYIFSNTRLIFWSDYVYVPKYRDVSGSYDLKCINTDKGKYLIRQWKITIQDKACDIIYMIPLEVESNVANQFIKSDFNHRIFSDPGFQINLDKANHEYPVGYEGNDLFYVNFQSSYTFYYPYVKVLLSVLVVVFLALLVLFMVEQTGRFSHAKRYEAGFIFLLLTAVILRSAMLITNFPFGLIPIDLFDVHNYASSMVNPSLGDLLLNLLASGGIAVYVFYNYYRSDTFKKLINAGKYTSFLVSMLLVFLTFVWLSVQFQIYRSLSFHSQWTMDVTEDLDFNYLKIISLIIFFISSVIYFLLSHVSFKLLFRLCRHHYQKFIVSFLIGTIAFILVSGFFNQPFIVIVLVNIAFYLVLYLFRLPFYVGRMQYLTFVYLFICGIPSAVIGAYANYQFYQNRTSYSKERLASQLLVGNDLFTEYLLTNAKEKIKNDAYIQNRIFSPYASKSFIEQKIKRSYLNNILDQYNVQVYVFNSKGEPFESSRTSVNYFDLKKIFKDYKTDIDGLYFLNQMGSDAASRYLYFIEIDRYNQVAGYVLLDLKLKRFVPNTVYPLLLQNNPYIQQPLKEDFSYGIFENDTVKYSYGSFNYRKNFRSVDFKNPKLFDEGIRKGDYHHYGFKSNSNTFIIISSKVYPLVNIISNFSFLFLIFVFSILLLLMFLSLYLWLKKAKQNYATRIQLYLNFAFFAPLIIISITTVSVIVQTYKSDLEFQYLDRAEDLSGKVSGPLNDFNSQRIDRERLENEIFQIAQYSELDINVFNSTGRLISSSQPLIYENELLSSHINPQAYIHIVEELDNSAIMNEQVGSLKFKDTYVSIKSFDDGSLIGILSLPFFASKQDLEQHIINVLSNVMNIFTFVFILFLLVSYVASGSLTFPLKLITQKIRRTTLSGYNEPLSWNSDDEIGLMVSEYNRMLVNLEESKEALARSEKESAWREMARQVAHEIKNPLTPMKLTLQHMKRRLELGEEDEKVNKSKQIETLLEQINTLSDIATSFSAFAKMPAPRNERFELTALIRETAALYDKRELGELNAHVEEGEHFIIGDRQWIGRAISNIIINGFQASQNKGNPLIKLRFYKSGHHHLRLEIEDNGDGIPKEIQEKVFVPNFSTKFSGSGIGLAIARRGIEHAGGKIWFNSAEGIGTVFYIEFPIA